MKEVVENLFSSVGVMILGLIGIVILSYVSRKKRWHVLGSVVTFLIIVAFIVFLVLIAIGFGVT